MLHRVAGRRLGPKRQADSLPAEGHTEHNDLEQQGRKFAAGKEPRCRRRHPERAGEGRRVDGRTATGAGCRDRATTALREIAADRSRRNAATGLEPPNRLCHGLVRDTELDRDYVVGVPAVTKRGRLGSEALIRRRKWWTRPANRIPRPSITIGPPE